MLVFTSCEEPVDPYPLFETVPHGFGKINAGTPTSFFYGNNSSKIDGTLEWISTDNAVKVTKIDIMVTWNESFKDKDGIGLTANHGKKVIKSITSVADQRKPNAFSVSAAEIYEKFKDVSFDYKDDLGSRKVFSSNPKDADRSGGNYFTSNDRFTVTWAFTGDDGRYFDSWSQGICSETVGSNCQLTVGVVCVSTLAGTYKSVATGSSTDDCCKEPSYTVSGEVTLTAKGTGTYEISDFSAGLYKLWYEIYGIDDAYVNAPTSKLKGNILDACNKVSGKWVEPFSESMEITGVSMPSQGKIVYDWKNGYGDKGTVTLTKK